MRTSCEQLFANPIDCLPEGVCHDLGNTLVRDQGWDPTFAYLHLLLGYIEDKTLPALTNADLFTFGKTLKPYAGLQDLLKDLRKIAHAELFDIEYYIISGGLQRHHRGLQAAIGIHGSVGLSTRAIFHPGE